MFLGVVEAIDGSILCYRVVIIIVLLFLLFFCMALFGDCTLPQHHETTIITGENLNIRVEKVGSAFYRWEESDVLYRLHIAVFFSVQSLSSTLVAN